MSTFDYTNLIGGALKPKEDFRWPLLAAAVPVGDLPGRAFCTLSSPQHQANASSCLPHAMAGALESESKARVGAAVQVNRMDLYFGARWLEGNGAETRDNGSFPDKAAEWLRSYGTVGEVLKRYNPAEVKTWRPPAAWADDRRLLTADIQPMQRSVDQIRSEVAADRPVVVCHHVYQQMTDEARTTGIERGSYSPANSLGGHARCIVGYDDTAGMFLIWNWWKGWGIAHPEAATDTRFAAFRDSFSWAPYAMVVDQNWSFFLQRIARGLQVEV